MSKIQDLVLTVITHAALYNSRPCLRHIYVRLTSSTGTFDLEEKIWHERPSRDGEFHFYPGGVRNLSRKCLTTWLDEIRYQIMRSIQRKGHRVCVWMAKVKKGLQKLGNIFKGKNENARVCSTLCRQGFRLFLVAAIPGLESIEGTTFI